ncbi:PREDICTED: diacylglycerol kinase theta-like [Amphimedon queenslandica]|uniref:Phorbol-ester/DAG-type domain-containing protein n=1 Tax=Amphimedon queenslandica TaxID=400682 RepID=A0AAN0IKA6_AMPQE|nr:PREDICTED: diacylglycerol kinase theta-like [Amphimedon queenslandica]|eukprot:XP_011402934.1 PREDICTED: diacylglycerol kinase theta-like [Amphimedon queenslandica]
MAAEVNGSVRSSKPPRSLERGSSAPVIHRTATTPTSPPPPFPPPSGHEFKKKTFYKLTHCQHCTEVLWGIKNQGQMCTVCNFVCHERCLPSLTVDCTHLLSEQITNPIGHTWIGPKSSANKRKWCNVCRKKITGSAMYCKVCRRYAHKYCIGHELNNCKECSSTCTTKTDFDHHWIEGNLTSHAKCEMCTKPCFTDLCLTGFRCGWCGITLHSSCFNAFIKSDKCKSCDFRDLSYMILPPYCVSMPISQKTLQQDETLEDVTELFSDEDETNAKSRAVIVIDGSQVNKKWRKGTLHPIHVDHKMTVNELLRISLRKCSVPRASDEYYLTPSSSREEADPSTILSGDDIIYNIPQSYPGPLKLYIRRRDTAVPTCTLRVFNNRLSSGVPLVNITIDESSVVLDIIQQALTRFELQEEDPSDYCLNEISQSGGVSQRMLPDDEKPWKQVQKLRKV